MAVTNGVYKCPECYGEMKWTPTQGKWVCQYCGSEYTLEDLKKQGMTADLEALNNAQISHRELEEDEKQGVKAEDGTGSKDVVGYMCSNCGAEVITSRNTASMVCPYCAYPMIMNDQFSGEYMPKGVLPFKVTKEKATETFRKFAKKPLTPKKFLDSMEIDKIQGVYAPFWLYSGKAMGNVTAECEKKGPWIGNSRTVEVYSCKRQYKLKYKNLPVDASKRIDNDAMDSIEPFDMKELKDFDIGYLAGFLAEKWDDTKEDCYERVKPRVIETGEIIAKEDLLSVYDNAIVKGNDSRIINETTDYVLLPTYLINVKYNNKDYLFAMNGQTGKFIGNLPIDKLKAFIFGGIGTVIGALLGYFIM